MRLWVRVLGKGEVLFLEGEGFGVFLELFGFRKGGLVFLLRFCDRFFFINVNLFLVSGLDFLVY